MYPPNLTWFTWKWHPGIGDSELGNHHFEVNHVQLGEGNSLKILLKPLVPVKNLSQFCRFGLRISRLCALPAALAGATSMLGLHDFLPLSSVSARDLEVEKKIIRRKNPAKIGGFFWEKKSLSFKIEGSEKNNGSLFSKKTSLKLTARPFSPGLLEDFLVSFGDGCTLASVRSSVSLREGSCLMFTPKIGVQKS